MSNIEQRIPMHCAHSNNEEAWIEVSDLLGYEEETPR